MTLNDVLSWLSDDYRQQLEAKRKRLALQQIERERKARAMSIGKSDALGLPFWDNMADRHPLLIHQLRTAPKLAPMEEYERNWEQESTRDKIKML